MTKAAAHNIRLTMLILAILAGVALQKHAHLGQHAGCDLCLHASQAS